MLSHDMNDSAWWVERLMHGQRYVGVGRMGGERSRRHLGLWSIVASRLQFARPRLAVAAAKHTGSQNLPLETSPTQPTITSSSF